MSTDFEDLKAAGVPLKELTKTPNSGFAELSSTADALSSVKKIENKDSIDELKALNQGFDPAKPSNAENAEKSN